MRGTAPSTINLDPVPPVSTLGIAVALTPAIIAAVFATASWSIGALSGARRAALRDALEGGARRALDRYLEAGPTIEARWLVIRSLAIAFSALLLAGELSKVLGSWAPMTAALVAVVVYVIPSEIGRAIFSRNAESAAPLLLQLLRPAELVAAPIADPIVRLAQLAGDTSPQTVSATPGVTEHEVELIVKEGEKNGSLGHDQSEMIRNVLDFGDATAGQLMVPRTQVIAFNIDISVAELMEQVAETEHSRFPVYRDSIDNIVGVLHTKDLFKHVARGELSNASVEQLMRQPVAFVPESQSATSVLKDMRVGRHHLAVVIDEFGGFSGIITLEDLLEEIVGDIRDEHDVDEAPIADLGDGRMLVDASVSITDLSRYLGAELPETSDYHTLAGFVVAQLGRVPEIGTRLSSFGLEFIVREADERRVCKVEIGRLAAPESIVPARSSSRMTAA